MASRKIPGGFRHPRNAPDEIPQGSPDEEARAPGTAPAPAGTVPRIPLLPVRDPELELDIFGEPDAAELATAANLPRLALRAESRLEHPAHAEPQPPIAHPLGEDQHAPRPEPARKGFFARILGRKESDEEQRPFLDADVTPIPPLAPTDRQVDFRAVRPPFAFVRIVEDTARAVMRYEVIEPPLSAEEQRSYQFLRETFLRTLDIDLDAVDRAGAREYLRERFNALARRHEVALSPLSRARLTYYLERDFLGFGPIDPVMLDPSIEDISCDGPAVPLFIYHRRYQSLRTNLVFPNDNALDGFVMQLVQRSGKHISVADPLVDATLPDGSRLQASLSREVTTRGSTFTIRKFRRDPFTPTDLIDFETASPDMVAFLWFAVEHGASGLICGGTASGKTTTLNALSLFIPAHKKIVSIEDTREINLVHENWIPGVTRAGGAGGEGDKRTGEVDMFDLLKAALRQRPEYLLLGEVRGPEAYVLFQAMATGHTVYSTMHADSVSSAVHRLESRPIEIPRNMLASLDFVAIQGETRVGDRRIRKLREITEITGIDPRTGELLTNRVFHWDAGTERFRYSGASHVLGRVAEEEHLSEDALRAEFDSRVRVLQAMQRKGLRDIHSFSRIVERYETDPAAVLAELEAAKPAKGNA